MPERLPRSILIVRLGAIGDVVNATTLATALKRSDPTVEIGWAVHPLAQPLVEGHPSIDRVHVWKREDGLAGGRALVREVREVGYELTVDLQRILKSALVTRLSRSPRTLSYDRGRTKELAWLLSRERIPAGDPRAHMVDQVAEFARHLGVADATPTWEFPADPDAERWAEERLEEVGAEPMALNLGASKAPNRWRPERWAELIGRLAEAQDRPLVVLGGPDDRGAAGLTLKRVADLGVADRVTDLVGRTSLRQLTALARRVRLFATCDTGPMHIAAAVGTPVLALFGPADDRRTGPYGEGHRVVRPEGSRSMDDLDVASVAAAALELLGG